MDNYRIQRKGDLIKASSHKHAMFKLAVDMTADKVKGMSKADKKKVQGKMYGILMDAFEAVKIDDPNQMVLNIGGKK